MNDQPGKHRPTELNLHAKSKMLTVAFVDGASFDLPCEYLRVFSRAAEVRTLDKPVTGKEDVNIERIEPLGQYAIRILFDDGHDTGIYSWDTLYSLGANQEANWSGYLQRLAEMGYERQEPDKDARTIKLFYFAWLARKLRKASEQVTLPPAIADVDALLRWLGHRRKGAAALFDKERVRVTVNKQSTEGFTKLHHGDEVAIVPNSPMPPATPELL